MMSASVRGLSVGAPVEIYGIKIGEVASIDLVYDEKLKNLRVPVVLSIEPERIANVLKAASNLQGGQSEPLLRWFVEERNLKAQLKTGNLLTGQLLVDLGGELGASPQVARKTRALKVAAEDLPDYIERLARTFLAQREGDEPFASWAHRADEDDLR